MSYINGSGIHNVLKTSKRRKRRMNRAKKIMLSTLCSILLLVSVFSTTANAGAWGTWTRFTQHASGFTLTGYWSACHQVTAVRSAAVGANVVRSAQARAGIRRSDGSIIWDTWKAPGVGSSITITGSLGMSATRQLALW